MSGGETGEDDGRTSAPGSSPGGSDGRPTASRLGDGAAGNVAETSAADSSDTASSTAGTADDAAPGDDTPEAALAALRARMRTLQLATVGEDGTPHTGYTPHLLDGPDILIFVSRLAAHTRDLLARPTAAVMLIADEAETSQIFARTRVSYTCEARVVPTDDPAYEPLLDAFQARHGKMIGLLRQLPDFVLFRLRPTAGQFVMGFGKAYRLGGDALETFEHARSG